MPCAAIDVLPRPLRALFAGFALALVAFVVAEPFARAEPLKLHDVEERALAQRSSIAAARARVSAARAGVDVAEGPRSPTLAGELTSEVAPGGRLIRVLDRSGDEYLVAGSRPIGEEGALIPDFRYGAGLALSGRLYDFGRTTEAVRAARAELGASNFDERAERRAILREVRSAYLDWLSASGTRELARRSAESARSLRETAEGRAVEGAVSGAEAAPARYDEARAKLDLERAETDLALARLALERASGGKLPPGAEPDAALLDARPPPTRAGDDPEPAALRRRAEARSAEAAAHRAAASRPVLSGAVELGVRGQTQNIFPVYRVGVSLAVPILGGGVESASARAANSQADELYARASEARARVALDRDRARLGVARADQELAVARQLVELAVRTVSDEEERFSLGSGSIRAVAQARLERSRAELELLTARVARARAVLLLSETAER